MPFEPSSLFDVSHLVTFAGGAIVASAGQYLGERFTDQRRKQAFESSASKQIGFACLKESDMRHIPATLRHAQARVLEMTQLSPGERITLAAILGRLSADGTGSCFASMGTLERDTGITERSLRRHLGQLNNEGLIAPAARGWMLTEELRSDLFKVRADLLINPDILSTQPDKMADRREDVDLSPSERTSPTGEPSDKPDWLTISAGGWRKLSKIAKQAGHQIQAVVKYAQQYIANLPANRAYAYLLKLLGQQKDYAWMAGTDYNAGANEGAEARKRDGILDAVRGKVLVDQGGKRYEVVGSVARCLNANGSLAGRALTDLIEGGKMWVLA